jgi:hypothetical protein
MVPRRMLGGDEAGQRPDTVLVTYKPNRVSVHDQQPMVELRVVGEAAHVA